MATALDRVYYSPFAPESYPTLSGGGNKTTIEQFGFRRSKNDKMDKPFSYYSLKGFGEVVAEGVKYPGDGYFYAPTVQSGDWPYSGAPYFLASAPWAVGPNNRAYEKFKENALGSSSQLGTLLAERKEAYGMVANRVLGLYRAYKDLRKGDFKGFLRELSVDPKRKHRSRTRSTAAEASGLWLEYWFGWSPTINDLYQISEVLAGPPPDQRYHGASGVTLPYTSIKKGRTDSAMARLSQEGKLIIKTGATVRLVNPDLQLLAQMGLVNPLSIAWEVIPFSFVIDWFTKFGNVIESTTDFVGTELTYPYTTRLLKTKGTFATGYQSTPWEYDYHIYRMTRSTSLLKPIATYPRLMNFGHSKTRAATAVSLLTQLFLAR